MVVYYNYIMVDKSKKYVLDDSLGHLTARFYRAIMKQINAEFRKENLEITLEQWPILVHVWDHNGISQIDLARKLFKDKTTVARLVAGIESSGMITRVPAPSDGRGKSIYLTDKGKSMMTKATAIVQRIDETASAGIDKRELAVCKNILRYVHGSIV